MKQSLVSLRIVPVLLVLAFVAGQSAAQKYGVMARRATMAYSVVTDAAPALRNHAEMKERFRGAGPNLPGEHAVSGHRIEVGEGIALSSRKHISFTEQGEADENAIFEKLTVFLPAALAGEYGIIDLSEHPEVVVFWSRGAANFDAAMVCAGYAESGEIEYRYVRGELQAKFDFRIDPVGADQYDGRECKPFRKLHDSWFYRSSSRALSPWQGGAWGRVTEEECRPDR
jgi:hypothetical protein